MSSSNRTPIDQQSILCIPEADFKEIIDYYHITPVHYYDYGKVCLHQEAWEKYNCATTCQARIEANFDQVFLVLAVLAAMATLITITLAIKVRINR